MNASDPISQREMTILDSVNEGVFTVDPDWRITAFNRAAEQITGVRRDQALGSLCCDVFKADICERDCALRKTLATGRPIVNATACIIDHEGGQVPIRLSTALLRDAEGRIVGGVETFQDLSQIEEMRRQLLGAATFADIVGRSPAMTRLFEILPQIAASSSTVLIEGPSGTGKELFARALHKLSPRSGGPFVAVNCGALPDALLESELFGHKAGAFTDARQDRVGRFALADGGTIFLDEVGDVSPAMQVRLLRVLQERVVEPLGSSRPQPVDVRVVAATNRNLARMVRRGEFREDLYYRVRVVHLELPGLARRREDIPLLVDHIIARFNRIQGRHVAGVTDRVMAVLMEHDYPGNVRELENIIEQAFVLCRGDLIDLPHLPPELRPAAAAGQPVGGGGTLAEMEKLFIAEALRRHEGNRARAAADLGINPSTLYRKILAYGIEQPQRDGRGRRR